MSTAKTRGCSSFVKLPPPPPAHQPAGTGSGAPASRSDRRCLCQTYQSAKPLLACDANSPAQPLLTPCKILQHDGRFPDKPWYIAQRGRILKTITAGLTFAAPGTLELNKDPGGTPFVSRTRFARGRGLGGAEGFPARLDPVCFKSLRDGKEPASLASSGPMQKTPRGFTATVLPMAV